MPMLDLALKDLLQIIRDRKSLLFLIIMPIVFTSSIALFTGGGTGSEDSRLEVGVINQDLDGRLVVHYQTLLASSEAIRPVTLPVSQEAKAKELIRDQKYSAILIIPADFSKQTLSGLDLKVTVIADAGSGIGQTAINAIQVANNRLLAAFKTAQLSAKAFEAQQLFKDETARQTYLDEAVMLAVEAWRKPPLTVQTQQGQQPANTNFNAYTQASPGMMVQFVIYGLLNSAMVLVLERKNRTLQRLLTTPVSRTEIIGGHLLALFLVVLTQEAVLVTFAQIAFGINYLREPLAVLLVMVAVGVWIASLGLLISAFARTPDQVVTWGLIAMFVFAVLGGCWFSLEITGQTFSAIGQLTPAAWAMQGFQNIIVRNLGLTSVLLPVGMLIAYAVVFFGIALWRISKT